MKFLYCDESNLDQKSGDFLIYGGLSIYGDKFLDLSDRIWKLRKKYNIDDSSETKYLPAPGEISGDYRDFKKDCIEIAIDAQCKFYTYQTLHDLARDTDLARRNGINELCLNFSYTLKSEASTGMILVDRFNDKGNKIDAHLANKFSNGLEGLPFSPRLRLERVVGLHYCAVGQSHMTYLIDIILGTYRTAFNIYARNQTASFPLAEEILKFLDPLFVKGSDGCTPRISISFSPLDVRVPKFRQKYVDMINNFNAAGYNLTQSY